MNTLQLIGFDLASKAERQALDKEVNKLAEKAQKKVGTTTGDPPFCYKVPGGPWLLKTEESVEQVFIKVDTEVAAVHQPGKPTRRLLALVLANEGEELVGAHRGFDDTAKWLKGVGFPLYNDEWYSPPRILAIRFALQAPARDDNRELHQAIWNRFHDCCKPLIGEWFVRTSQPPEEVCRYLEPFLPDKDRAELLVLHPRGPAAESGLERIRADTGWLWENGIPVKHRWH